MKYTMTNKTGATALAVRVPGGHSVCSKGKAIEVDSGKEPFDKLYLERLETSGFVIEGGEAPKEPEAKKPAPKEPAKKPAA